MRREDYCDHGADALNARHRTTRTVGGHRAVRSPSVSAPVGDANRDGKGRLDRQSSMPAHDKAASTPVIISHHWRSAQIQSLAAGAVAE
jgi:hypothetical protein